MIAKTIDRNTVPGFDKVNDVFNTWQLCQAHARAKFGERHSVPR
jgi:hypothetical protein